MQSEENKLWLVKSGERLSGPFTTDEMLERIRSKDIAIIDEVSAPESRWHYVRDEALFASAVEEARKGIMQNREDTEVQGYTMTRSGSDGADLSSAETLAAIEKDREFASPFAIKDADYEDVIIEPKAKSEESVKSYGVAGKKSASRSVRLRMSTVFLVVAAIAMATLAAVIYSTSGESGAGSRLGVNVLSQASRHWERGEFESAYRAYRKVGHANLEQPEIAMRLAVLILRYEGSTVEAKRLIQDSEDSAVDEGTKREIVNALGLTSLQEDDLETARSRFREAAEKGSRSAAFNLGVVDFKSGMLREALENLRKAGESPWTQLMIARTQIQGGDTLGGAPGAWRESAQAAIDKILVNQEDYRQEALMLSAFIDSVTGEKKRASQRAREAFDTDPEQTAEHWHDPMLALEPLNWKSLLPYCKGLHQALNDSTSRALLSICEMRAGNHSAADKLLSEELNRVPNDGFLQTANAYRLLLSGADDGARGALKIASKSNPSRLAAILSARLCSREKNNRCAEDLWARLAAEAKPPIGALVRLADLRFKMGDAASAGALLVKAQSISPRYLPLIRLREDSSQK